jgi:hypothetical protein
MSSSNSQSSFTPVSLQSVGVANRSQNSKIVANNFTKIDDRSYQCNICKYVSKQQQKAGHGNLVKHHTLTPAESLVMITFVAKTVVHSDDDESVDDDDDDDESVDDDYDSSGWAERRILKKARLLDKSSHWEIDYRNLSEIIGGLSDNFRYFIGSDKIIG